MKKFLLIVGVIVLCLFMVDKMILQDKGIVNNLNQKYDRIENPETIQIGIEEGRRAPDFTLADLNGNIVKLSDYKGKKVLLNFWATWCPPCKAEMPHMEKLYQKYKKDGFEILGVNVTTSEKNRNHVDQFVEDYQLTFTIPLDEKGKAFSDYSIMVYPTSFFIDSDGIIRKKVLGAVDEDAMEKLIQRLP
ncbi:TlpA disulfide reductase family protein [Bacillus sp. DTU_2020_1000418_1_SI_GHA_SEK_038]|uniref:peroxiredoxin family protein n=1 Tax=Bacillus sp. DTU_2020_1000418_1_SI_GHA_SEK_038 TaxID=3077585 RepID=UPI0028EA8D05|nr:TlpA disulfide reductase family protein [Bacillus sp. DTU_2020_1000418_1_SI_GHA_SEK_038]WNS73854.1 TlpA disulfide reductase family protein [Bacillus sp. DTU_2020_1000418_1_SI_GHA_SEK_038]